MPCGIICGRITPARGNLEHRPLSGAVSHHQYLQIGCHTLHSEGIWGLMIAWVIVGHLRVTVGHLRVTIGHPRAGCQNTREWGIRFPESSGLNHNLADRFRENKKFKVFLSNNYCFRGVSWPSSANTSSILTVYGSFCPT